MRATLPPEIDEQLVSWAFYQDPYPYYAELRAHSPVAFSEALGGWLLTRYEDVLATLQDTRHFSSQGRMLAALERLPDAARQHLKPFEDHFTVGLISSDPPTHTRLPRYVRGHAGTVVLVHGCHVFPDVSAHGGGEDPQWLYTVRFDGRDLWGPDADRTVAVSVDAFEPYLEAAT